MAAPSKLICALADKSLASLTLEKESKSEARYQLRGHRKLLERVDTGTLTSAERRQAR